MILVFRIHGKAIHSGLSSEIFGDEIIRNREPPDRWIHCPLKRARAEWKVSCSCFAESKRYHNYPVNNLQFSVETMPACVTIRINGLVHVGEVSTQCSGKSWWYSQTSIHRILVRSGALYRGWTSVSYEGREVRQELYGRPPIVDLPPSKTAGLKFFLWDNGRQSFI